VTRTSFKRFVEDQLAGLRGVACRAMFGGYGLYHRGVFFGIIFKDQLYFRTDANTRATYETQGMKPFRPSAKQTLVTYYEVPAEVLENAEMLAAWAAEAARAKRPTSRAPRGHP
jgi:DNA transformation protein